MIMKETARFVGW